jgi:hypothetical protein
MGRHRVYGGLKILAAAADVGAEAEIADLRSRHRYFGSTSKAS